MTLLDVLEEWVVLGQVIEVDQTEGFGHFRVCVVVDKVLDYLDLPVGVGQVEFTRIIMNLAFTKTGSKLIWFSLKLLLN